MSFVNNQPRVSPSVTKKEVQDKPIGRILYTSLHWRAIIPLGSSLLTRSSHLPACLDGPPSVAETTRMPIWCCSG